MAFHEGVGHSAAGTSMDLYRISTAYIGFATLTRRPALLIAALSCLDAADAMEDAAPGTAPGQAPQDARRAVEERQRRSVARAAARLLLGDTEAAKAALGWQQGRPADRQVAAFVKVGEAKGCGGVGEGRTGARGRRLPGRRPLLTHTARGRRPQNPYSRPFLCRPTARTPPTHCRASVLWWSAG